MELRELQGLEYGPYAETATPERDRVLGLAGVKPEMATTNPAGDRLRLSPKPDACEEMAVYLALEGGLWFVLADASHTGRELIGRTGSFLIALHYARTLWGQDTGLL